MNYCRAEEEKKAAAKALQEAEAEVEACVCPSSSLTLFLTASMALYVSHAELFAQCGPWQFAHLAIV